ncbi:MAG: hypothetical protein ABIH22_01355, partial [Candidatus Margulisiibacteriota bacterium]
KDTKGVLNELSVKLEDYAKASHYPAMAEQFEMMLKEDIFKSELEKVAPKNIKAEKVNGLWHVYDGEKELIRYKYSDGSTGETTIYVGEVEGKLKVIR